MTWTQRSKPDAPVPAALMRHIIWPAMRDGAERRRQAAKDAPLLTPPSRALAEPTGFLPFAPAIRHVVDDDDEWGSFKGAVAAGAALIALGLFAWLGKW